ncbi:MAG: hypothetical protein JWN25_1219, partial [Verrucomicrobiales bacterium]|nr:hypothetical protein [Verrucomicrobiales bacterium]
KFLEDCQVKISPLFLMVSLPPTFSFPEESHCHQILTQAVLPHCLDFNLPFALMPGVRRAVNPSLRLAGDGIGHSNIRAVENLCLAFPQNKFLVTVLGRENQHELCIAARKFRNLHIFGCWWFTNIPFLIDEITRLRLELLGASFTVQHSDARVMDQVIYKWAHTKEVLSQVLTEKYQALSSAGWELTPARIEKDVHQLLGGAFYDFCRNP